jgi:Zn-dependent protease
MKLFDWGNKRNLLIQIGLFVGSSVFFVFILGWRVTAIFMPILIIHELGHLWAMSRFGVKTAGVYFTPLGAIAPAAFRPDFSSEAWIGIMGPLWGFGSALVALILFVVHPSAVFLMALVIAAILNLFQLIPVLPLDGSRVLRALTGSLKPKASLYLFLIYTGLGILLLLKLNLFMAVVIVVLGWNELVMEFDRRRFLVDLAAHPEQRAHRPYYDLYDVAYYRTPLSRKNKIWLTIIYVGLVLPLSLMSFYALWFFSKAI